MAPYLPKDTLALLAKIPAIPVRQDNLTDLFGRLKILINRSPRAKLVSILKYAVYVVFLVNAGSWPFVWHIRVFWPVLAARLDSWILRLKFVLASKQERMRRLVAWGENLSPVGANPFELTTVYTRWASIDDIDVFGMHLSNSSYAKAFDSARLKAAVKCFPAWGRSGGQLALAGKSTSTHYHFIREIPPLVKYEVRSTIGAWDHKWLYVVARYVTQPGQRHGSSRSGTPSPVDTPSQNGTTNVDQAIAAIVRNTDSAASGRRAPIVEPDGAVLHCVAVARICFKQGRITVPPGVVLASEGFTKPYGDGGDDSVDGVRSYSRANPPPNWIASQSLRVPPHGSMENFRAFLKGKWRDVPEGERWWEDALGGSIEGKRRANLEMLESLRIGLEQSRTLHGQQ